MRRGEAVIALAKEVKECMNYDRELSHLKFGWFKSESKTEGRKF